MAISRKIIVVIAMIVLIGAIAFLWKGIVSQKHSHVADSRTMSTRDTSDKSDQAETSAKTEMKAEEHSSAGDTQANKGAPAPVGDDGKKIVTAPIKPGNSANGKNIPAATASVKVVPAQAGNCAVDEGEVQVSSKIHCVLNFGIGNSPINSAVTFFIVDAKGKKTKHTARSGQRVKIDLDEGEYWVSMMVSWPKQGMIETSQDQLVINDCIRGRSFYVIDDANGLPCLTSS